MNTLDLVLHREPIWPDLAGKMVDGKLIHLQNGVLGVGVLANGTTGGKPSVAIRIDLPDGQTVIFETTLAIFLTAADAMREAHGDPRRDTP